MFPRQALLGLLAVGLWVGAACAEADRGSSDDDDGDDDGVSTGGAGGAGGSTQSVGGSGAATTCTEFCYEHEGEGQLSGGCDVVGATFETPTSPVSCVLSWDQCSDDAIYEVSCTGSVGDWSCECHVNGPATSSFSSDTFCEWTAETAAREEANTACGWAIQ